MSGENRFEILLAPEIGDGVNTHVQKFVDSSPDELELIIKPVPHVETALELLIDGHADIILFLANGGIIIETGIFLPH